LQAFTFSGINIGAKKLQNELWLPLPKFEKQQNRRQLYRWHVFYCRLSTSVLLYLTSFLQVINKLFAYPFTYKPSFLNISDFSILN